MPDVTVRLNCATCGEPVEAFASSIRMLRLLGAPEDWYCRIDCRQKALGDTHPDETEPIAEPVGAAPLAGQVGLL